MAGARPKQEQPGPDFDGHPQSGPAPARTSNQSDDALAVRPTAVFEVDPVVRRRLSELARSKRFPGGPSSTTTQAVLLQRTVAGGTERRSS